LSLHQNILIDKVLGHYHKSKLNHLNCRIGITSKDT